jgi:hypothetical protein
MDREHAARLQEFLVEEANRRVTLDLAHLTLVDRAAVYVRSWDRRGAGWATETPSRATIELLT